MIMGEMTAIYQKNPLIGQLWEVPKWRPPLKVDIGVLVRSLTWQSFVCGHVVFSEWKNNSDRG